MKKPEGKHMPHLIYQSTIIAVSRQREYGIAKHGSVDGWKTTSVMEHLDAARRHIDEAIEAVRRGDGDRLYDADSGQLHYAAAICNLMFEIERVSIQDSEIDPRPLPTGDEIEKGGRDDRR